MRITITCGASDSDFPGFTNRQIQAAVNAAAGLGGGEVVLSRGTFALEDSVHMKTGVVLRGQGDGTVLLKDPMVEDLTMHNIGYGHCEIMVEHPERFRPGMGVYITDDRCSGGFLATQSTVTSVTDHLLGLTDPLNCDVSGANGGRIRTLFPLIKGSFEKNFAVRDLVLDGNRSANGKIDGCRGGCVFLIGCSHVTLTGLECRNYDRDGISYQQCYEIRTENCHVHHMAGHGLHPGSGTIRSQIVNCHIHDNGEDGVFYCLRTQYLLLQGCLIENNHRFGICVCHHDHYTDILDNTVRNNGWEGLFFQTILIDYGTGRDATVARNRFSGNGHTEDEPRYAEIQAVEAMDGHHMYDNVVEPGDKIPLILLKRNINTYIFDNNFVPVCGQDRIPGDESWYSSKNVGKDRSIDDYPITEETLAHLRHICR